LYRRQSLATPPSAAFYFGIKETLQAQTHPQVLSLMIKELKIKN
jgi:hypothetical protein